MIVRMSTKNYWGEPEPTLVYRMVGVSMYSSNLGLYLTMIMSRITIQQQNITYNISYCRERNTL